MKQSLPALFRLGLLAAVAGGLVLFTNASRAEEFVRYKARPVGNKVHIDGSANVHDWTMDGSIIGGWFEVPAGVTLDSSQAGIGGATDKLSAHAEVRIPVATISSGTPAMDAVMQDAMDAKTHESIDFRLSEMTLKQPHTAGTPFQFDTKGDLIINGVTNKIAMPITIETVDKTRLKIVGGPVPIKMLDYKVSPPIKAALFITKPDVKISFTWMVGLPAKPAAPK